MPEHLRRQRFALATWQPWHALRDRPPAAAVAGKKVVGFLRAIAAGAIGWEIFCWRIAPGVDERLNRAPACLDAVGAGKQDGVADHAVVDQRFVAGRRRNVEIILV